MNDQPEMQWTPSSSIESHPSPPKPPLDANLSLLASTLSPSTSQAISYDPTSFNPDIQQSSFLLSESSSTFVPTSSSSNIVNVPASLPSTSVSMIGIEPTINPNGPGSISMPNVFLQPPMAPSLIPGGSAIRPLNVTDALSYLDQVKAQFPGSPAHKYSGRYSKSIKFVSESPSTNYRLQHVFTTRL
ncbi:hypothetical protein HK096_004194 [Nowakowskiella sp. JEL0078]|nr:hypothetical protein HK096_004194 [Nowakowskiella sp. JEL0078]